MIDLLLKHSPSPIQKLSSTLLEEKEVQLFVKRDDQLHLEAMGHNDAFCGNKWRKLKYNLLKAKELQATTLLTFGGAFSNHIAAVAAAGARDGDERLLLMQPRRRRARGGRGAQDLQALVNALVPGLSRP